MARYRAVTTNLPYDIYQRIKKTREELGSVAGLTFASESDYLTTLIIAGLESAEAEINSFQVIETPEIVVPDGPWRKDPPKETPFLR